MKFCIILMICLGIILIQNFSVGNSHETGLDKPIASPRESPADAGTTVGYVTGPLSSLIILICICCCIRHYCCGRTVHHFHDRGGGPQITVVQQASAPAAAPASIIVVPAMMPQMSYPYPTNPTQQRPAPGASPMKQNECTGSAPPSYFP